MVPRVEEPPPSGGRRRLLIGSPPAGDLASILRCWHSAAATLLARPHLTAAAREVIECQTRLCDEMFEWVQRGGRPPGELRVAFAEGVPQGIVALEPLARSLFVHYLVSAPWNALTSRDVADLRSVRGTCTALIADAVQRSSAQGLSGLLSLEAINPRCQAVYDHLGFVRPPLDELSGIVPAGLYQPAEVRAHCWMLLESARSPRFGALAVSRPKAA